MRTSIFFIIIQRWNNNYHFLGEIPGKNWFRKHWLRLCIPFEQERNRRVYSSKLLKILRVLAGALCTWITCYLDSLSLIVWHHFLLALLRGCSYPGVPGSKLYILHTHSWGVLESCYTYPSTEKTNKIKDNTKKLAFQKY